MQYLRFAVVLWLMSLGSGRIQAQETPTPENATQSGSENPVLKHRPAVNPEESKPILREDIELTVPKRAALQVVLDRETRIRNKGQAIHGHLMEPVYVFDKLVLPVGTEVSGKIKEIGSVSTGRRALAALDANFTPARQITVEFTELTLAGGRRMALQTTVAPGSGQVLRFSAGAENEKKKSVKDAAIEKERQAKEEARRQFNAAMQQVKQPGKLHRLARYAVAQLPVHPQYIDAGTVYFAELGEPLQFGTEPLTADMAASMNGDIPEGAMVHAQLVTPLSSATTQKGAEVEARLSRPVMDSANGDKLILPEGSLLKGTVVQAEPARHWKHNGQLRFVFRELELPNGVGAKVEAMVQAVESGAAENLSLDGEGGAEAKSSKTRYLRSGVAVGLAAATHEDDPLNRVEGGAGGFRVVGIIIGAAVRSQPLAIAMGGLGALRSIYNNFISRGTEVTFAKHTAMEIGVRTRTAGPSPAGAVPR